MPFIVGLVNECSDIDKKLKKCSVDIGGEEEVIIVTNAPNVRCGTRTVVALVGTEFDDESKVDFRECCPETFEVSRISHAQRHLLTKRKEIRR